ncbi:hypothetical protein BDV32DRAFT_156065 [Aspergillus pseudonomiae]|uniref:Uncharacterized protein n=1 Tax=Aspergillus pseudonomiae TaxID=1506151 RepID=A0A5N6HJN7_9EURO|nr:uncharacterized protein BDV37DRAFT_286931 [Aspergillus pseudonomiae]KAB8253530.1 hypothetical protein BDV32DRAFT_156065 [Aspergillus pseudonomiae]KAE8400071.1 hypothetical protein BDV37DRAFT_286931 [Aspergillus pseudonomiae]
MKFHVPLLLLANAFTYLLAEAPGAGTALDVRSHARDFGTRASNALPDLDLSKRAAPPVPAGKDATRLHVWIRTDGRPSTYDDRSGAKHDGLNQLMKDTGGRHKDVVIGNSKGYYEYGLQFNDPSWQKKPNGDGAAVSEYAGPYVEVKGGHESYEYKGEVRDKKKTLNSISNTARTEISGKVYNHQSYNCGTFAQDLVHALV